MDFSFHVRSLNGYLATTSGYYLTPSGRYTTNKISLSLVLTKASRPPSFYLLCYQWVAFIKIRGTEQMFGNTFSHSLNYDSQFRILLMF